jgi:hypothetical protein
MTVKEARRLSTGQAVYYKGELYGVVTNIKFSSAFIQFDGRATALEIPHDQMQDIEKAGNK